MYISIYMRIYIIYIYIHVYIYMHICIYIYIYNPDRLQRIRTFSALRVSTKKKKLRIFGVEIFGVEFWSAQPEPKQIP